MYKKILITLDATPTDRAILDHVKPLARLMESTVVLLRWALIIAFSYLLLLDPSASHVQTPVVLLIVVALSSNLLVARMPDRWTEGRLFDFGIVLFDAGWVTLGLIWAPSISGNLFLLYFLVIFVAAMGESLPTIVGSAGLIGLVYGLMMTFQPSSKFQLTTAVLMRLRLNTLF